MAEANFKLNLPRGVQTGFQDDTPSHLRAGKPWSIYSARLFAPPNEGHLVVVRRSLPAEPNDPFGRRSRFETKTAKVIRVVHLPAYDGGDDDGDEPMIDVHLDFDFEYGE